MSTDTHPRTVTEESFESVILEAEHAVLEFWEPRCYACQGLTDDIERLSRDLKNEAVVGTLNVADYPDLARAQGIEVVPTMLVYRKGTVDARLRGAEPIRSFINTMCTTTGVACS
jgi:thioredoxin 1